MALRMAEQGEDFALLFTPAGDEPRELFAHVYAIACRTGKELIEPPNKPLDFWIDFHHALPNWRMRWCTRQIKIQPCIEWLQRHPGTTLCVGLRADEEARQGIYGDYGTYRYPLREWDWGDEDVRAYLRLQGVAVPSRTNCDLCYGQRLSEWWELWKRDPEKWAKGEAYEATTGHTFRSEGRDSWPAALADMRVRFEAGDIPRDVELNRSLFDDMTQPCRVCTL